MEPKRILLAEDNPYDVELTLEALSENSLANCVDVVKDGVDAMEYLRCEGGFTDREKSSPAVVLLDIKMPRMDGLEVLSAIRKDPDLNLLPVVMLTSSRKESDLIKGYKLGANAYVVKPVEFDNFMQCIKQVGGFWAVINELPSERG
jgi:CheY-like chemotaxis protein